MKKYIITERPLPEERELAINLYLDENNQWVWEIDTNIAKYINALKKRGWEQLSEHTLKSDGTVQAASFRSYDKKPISFFCMAKIYTALNKEERFSSFEVVNYREQDQRQFKAKKPSIFKVFRG